MTASLAIGGLTIAFSQPQQEPKVVVDDVDLALHPGKITGLAGESGCGKSTTALSGIGFPIPGAVRLSGTARLDGKDLLAMPLADLRKVWGKRIGYVAQGAVLALDPLQRVGKALAEPLALHLGMTGEPLRQRTGELLETVGISSAATTRYPHEFSGGQRQRITIAIAIACNPDVLVLDEPTTGLDVTTQAQIIGLIGDLVRRIGTAAVIISHDLALLATVCDEIAIMYAGQVVEQADANTIYAAPRHPYTSALIDAVPRIDDIGATVGIPGLPPPGVVRDRCAFSERCRFAVAERCHSASIDLHTVAEGHTCRCARAPELGVIPSARSTTPHSRIDGVSSSALALEDVVCSYFHGRERHTVVDGVSLEVANGETLAIVGESGSGKSTLLRAIAGLHAPDSGTIFFRGAALPQRASSRGRTLCRAIQIVFQDPASSLNPRHTIGQLIARPVRLFHPDLRRQEVESRVSQLLADVRLDDALRRRRPHELSGGQLQRVALARAFAADPELILCDEVVSALDVSVQAVILELLAKLTAESSTAALFVTHDLAVARSIADRVVVMRAGVVCETGRIGDVFASPESDYTRTLLAAVPEPPVSLRGQIA